MRTILMLAVALVSSTCLAGETIRHSIDHGGRNRSFSVYVPDSYSAGSEMPLVLNLHGTRGTSAGQAAVSEMNDIAEAEGFLVAYPQAVMSTASGVQWNTLQLPNQVNDIDFLANVVDQVSADYDVDERRVYSTGFSNGGSMTYLLGHVMPDRIAAIAPMSAHIAIRDGSGRSGPFDPLASPTTSRPMPMTLIHGTKDYLVPFDGGTSPLTGSLYPAVDDVLATWVSNNGCDAIPTISPLPDVVSTDRSTAELHTFNGCSSYLGAAGQRIESEVQLYKIIDGNHQWPGGASPPPLDNSLLQPRNDDINASQEIWNFFSRHQLPSAMPDSNAVVLDDFEDGAINGWTSLNALQNNGLGDALIREEAGVLSVASVDAVPFGSMEVVVFDESSKTDLYSNGILRVTVEANGTETDIGITVRTAISEDGEWLDGGAGLAIGTNSEGGSIGIASIPDSMPIGITPFPGLETFDLSPVMGSNVRYIVEATMDGDDISLKVWEEGQPESDAWQLATTSFPSDAGTFALSVWNSPPGDVPMSASFDNVTFEQLVPGDFDNNKQLDAGDIDRLTSELRSGNEFRILDLNRDGKSDGADRRYLIEELANTYIGDSNLDGEFNSGDFVQIFAANEYEDDITGNSTWATGDWNGDAEFDSGDFVLAFSAGGYEKGPRVATAAVPEPNGLALLSIVLLIGPSLRRR